MRSVFLLAKVIRRHGEKLKKSIFQEEIASFFHFRAFVLRHVSKVV